MRLEIPTAYNFPLLLIFISRWKHASIDVVREGYYRRVLRQRDMLVLIEAYQAEGNALEVRILASSGQFDPPPLAERLAWVLHLDSGAAAFWDWARLQSELWPVIAPVEGLPLPRTETLYEAVIFTIIEQQIAWTAAQRAQRLLCEWGDEALDYDGERYYAIPSPARLASADPVLLKPLKITDRRVGVLIRIADDAASGRLDLEALLHLPPPERYARLTAIKGIGHWTAVMALARAYGTHPATASNDVALRAAVKLYLPQYAAEADPIAAAFDIYGDYAGPAAMFLLSRYVIDRY